MCPNMHFGIAFGLAAEYDAQRFQYSLQALAAAPPFLNCLIAQAEDGSLYYEDTGSPNIWDIFGEIRKCSFLCISTRDVTMTDVY